MHAGEFGLQKRVQSLKRVGVEGGGVFVRDGRDSDGPSEPLGGALPDSDLRDCSNLDPVRPVTQRSNQHNAGDQNERGADE